MYASPASFDTSSVSPGGGLAADATIALLMLLILANTLPKQPRALIGAEGWNQTVVSNMLL